jgi:hypothetical protein
VAKSEAKATREDLIRENERYRTQLDSIKKSRLGNYISQALRSFFKWASWAFIAWVVVGQLAGKVTVVDAKIAAAMDVCASLADILKEIMPNWIVLAILLLVTFIMWVSNARFRRTNKSLASRLGKMKKQYEETFDANRSSSGLGLDGQTHIEDE